ncbi:MAG: hypothetical protein M3P33_00280 [bacterium]|nr:hypothetical protein [bacterium]
MAQIAQIKASTQEHLEIDEIYDDLVLLKSGGATLVIQTTAVNFGLLSEPEQDAIIYAYAGLLNSLSFPIQIVVRSKRMDVSSYLESLVKWEQKQANEKIRIQIKKYREFISSTIRENNVLDKKFFVVIPMFPEELGIGGASPLSFGSAKKQTKYSNEFILDRAKNSLFPKRDHLMRQLARLGLKATHLATQQLIELYYDIYNPSVTGAQKLATRTNEYLSPIVSSSSEIKQATKPAAPTHDVLASEMSPASLFRDQTSKTSLIEDSQTPTIQKSQSNISQSTTNPFPLNPTPATNWEQTIQNAQTPWPSPASQPSPDHNTVPLSSGSQSPDNNTPNPWSNNLSSSQKQPPIVANPDQVVLNLQKAIEEARKRSTQSNQSTNNPTTQNINNN